MRVEEYIKQHTDIDYCEAIVFPNGDIEDVRMGHVNYLIKISGKSWEEMNEIMPDTAAPIYYMVCYTGCVSLWYDFFIYNEISPEQEKTLKMLVNNDILADGIVGYYTNELEHCNLLKRLESGENVEFPERKKTIISYKKEEEN